MAKKKEENKIPEERTTVTTKEVADLRAKLEEHDVLLGRIKTGIQTLETMVSQLKERNRLR